MGTRARAHTHTHTHTYTHTHPSSSHILQSPLFTEEQPLSAHPLPRPDSGSSFIVPWASPELVRDSSPAPKPLSMVVENPKHSNHPGEEEMQATWGIGSPWMTSCPRPFWVVIFEDVKLIQQKPWDPCCRPLLHVAHDAELCSVLRCSGVSILWNLKPGDDSSFKSHGLAFKSQSRWWVLITGNQQDWGRSQKGQGRRSCLGQWLSDLLYLSTWASGKKKCYGLGGLTRNLFSHSFEKSKIIVGTSQQFSFRCKLFLACR